MTTEEVIKYISTGEVDKLKSFLDTSKIAYFITDALNNAGALESDSSYSKNDLKQYNPKLHDIHNKSVRPDKVIKGDNGEIEKIVTVSRLSIPQQKDIVLKAAAFLGSPKFVSSPKEGIETDMVAIVDSVFEDNKLNYKFKDIAKTTMSERECAELWYTQPAEPEYWEGTPMSPEAKRKLRVRLLSPSRGDTCYPVFDNSGDMTAFGRMYESTILVDDKQEKYTHFEVYTKDSFYFMRKKTGDSTWQFQNANDDTEIANTYTDSVVAIPNSIKKIPVIYYSQPATEWYDVQEMIERLEKKTSNHADTNDYYDSPIVKAKGKVEGFSSKGESGKVLQMEQGADVEYLTYDSLPESMKMEMDNLLKFIHTYTHTPDISFDNVKGLGQPSGFSLKMLFMDAHLKASDKEELFGEGVQRRINYIKSAIAVINQKFKAATRVTIRPKFEYFLPKDVDGEVSTLVKAVGAGILSVETAVKLNPLVEDAANEMKLIKAEKDSKPTGNPPI